MYDILYILALTLGVASAVFPTLSLIVIAIRNYLFIRNRFVTESRSWRYQSFGTFSREESPIPISHSSPTALNDSTVTPGAPTTTADQQQQQQQQQQVTPGGHEDSAVPSVAATTPETPTIVDSTVSSQHTAIPITGDPSKSQQGSNINILPEVLTMRLCSDKKLLWLLAVLFAVFVTFEAVVGLGTAQTGLGLLGWLAITEPLFLFCFCLLLLPLSAQYISLERDGVWLPSNNLLRGYAFFPYEAVEIKYGSFCCTSFYYVYVNGARFPRMALFFEYLEMSLMDMLEKRGCKFPKEVERCCHHDEDIEEQLSVSLG